MILIGDAGGTTTHWRVIHDDQSIDQFETRGLNLMHHAITDFLTAIQSDLEPYHDADEVYFYLAGYFESSVIGDELKVAFSKYFTKGSVTIKNDLIAAARSLCGHQPGWVGILGTGANVAFYNGKKIKSQVPPLGYLFGDEGGGAHLGKEFIKLFFRGKLAQTISNDFLLRYNLKVENVLASIYSKNDPKLFLSSFSSFLFDHKNDAIIYRLIYAVFEEHFKVFLATKEDDLPIHYTGSIAYHFGDILRQVAADHEIVLGQITKDPIAGLALFHQN